MKPFHTLIEPVKTGIAGLTHLFYPELCVSCGYELPSADQCFCFSCKLKLEPTHMHREPQNAFTERFWGRLPLHSAQALYYFTRKTPIQKALHALKYKNRPEVGFQLGRAMGLQLLKAKHIDKIDAIIPVPMHPKKERSRGYNQSLWIARGLLSRMPEAALLNKVLIRLQNTGSQTKRRRMERYQNVVESYALRNSKPLQGKHVLLVDDVMTTGATLETCGQLLLDGGAEKLSLATIAIAINRV